MSFAFIWPVLRTFDLQCVHKVYRDRMIQAANVCISKVYRDRMIQAANVCISKVYRDRMIQAANVCIIINGRLRECHNKIT